MLDRAAEFRHRLAISRQILPARQRRARLPRKVPPKSIALSYYRAIAPILARARRMIEQALAPRLPELARQAEAAVRHDAVDINAIIDAVGKEFFDSLKPAEITALAEQFARATSDHEKEQAVKQVRAAFGVDVMAREPNLAAKEHAFISENVALIKSIPSQFFDDVEKRVARAVATGATAKELAAEIAGRYKVADDRAMLIARDQVGKYYGQVAEARQVAMGVTKYTWETSNDERVREEHAARQGQVFSWDDPPEGGHPGEDFQCRCFASPLLDELLDGDEPHAQEIASREEETPPEVEQVAAPVEAPVPEPTPVAEDVESIKASHAAELERRLAEQEAVREALRQAVAERERLAAEAERKRLEDEAAHAAELERQRLAAEAEAKRQAEEHAREVAAANRAAHEANLARQEAEERARALQAPKDPLVQKHLEQASGMSGRDVRAREAHLEQMRSEPVDHAVLAKALSKPKSEKSQAAIREELNRIVAHEGARIDNVDRTAAGGRQITVAPVKAHQADAIASHGWDGQIKVNSQTMLDNAASAARNVAQDPDHYRKTLTSLEDRSRALSDEADRRQAEMREGQRPGESTADYHARHRENSVRLAAIDGERTALLAQYEKHAHELKDMGTLVHENYHAHSGMVAEAYRDRGVVAEEVATEMAARATMERQFGMPGDHDAGVMRSYTHYIDRVTDDLERLVGSTKQEAYDKLKSASLAMKQDHVEISRTPEAHATRLASKLADEYGLIEPVRSAFIKELTDGFGRSYRAK